MDMVNDVEGVEMSGLLELAPDSWWLQLITMLPAKDRLALFQVSRQCASRVVQCSAKVALYLQDKNYKQLTSGEADARRSVITELLRARCSFETRTDFQHQSHVPFPTSLSHHIASLDICLGTEANPASAYLDWHPLYNLQVLVYSTSQSSDQDISRLCDALEAGQLPCLREVTFKLGLADLPNPLLERLARALGPQLRHLATNRGSLLMYLPQFNALRTVRLLSSCHLTPHQAQALCEHPNLDTVHLGYGFKVQRDHSQRRCSWGMLQVDDPAWGMLPALPLSGVQHVRVVGRVIGLEELQRQAIRDVLMRHNQKFLCQPIQRFDYKDLPTFSMVWPCEEMLPLLPQIQIACRLRLHKEPPHVGVLHAFWKALPACVHVVALEEMHGVDWAHVWQGLPEHVHKLEVFFSNDLDLSDLCTFVRTTPKHVTAMDLAPCPWPRGQYAVWEAAGVLDNVPGHLALHLRK